MNGTGQQVISASQYKDAEITAIDLSDASVAYAKQKADEYGMNVRFIVMDLLNVELLQQQFDIIECMVYCTIWQILNAVYLHCVKC